MEGKDERMQDRLLSHLPKASNLAEYRKEVAALLQKNDKAFLREKWFVRGLWFLTVVAGTVLLYHGGLSAELNTPRAAWYGSLACYVLIYGAVELLKHFINRSRVELLKEVKQVQVQVLELQERLGRTV